jgi:hypothetical protein
LCVMHYMIKIKTDSLKKKNLYNYQGRIRIQIQSWGNILKTNPTDSYESSSHTLV